MYKFIFRKKDIISIFNLIKLFLKKIITIIYSLAQQVKIKIKVNLYFNIKEKLFIVKSKINKKLLELKNYVILGIEKYRKQESIIKIKLNKLK